MLNPSRQYSKHQTRGEEIEKCLDGGLEPTYFFSIFTSRQLGQIQSNSVHSGPKEGSHISAGTESESSISGIVHSVHIRTGQSELNSPQVMSSGVGAGGTTMVTSTTGLGPAPLISQNNLNSSLRRTTSR